MRHPSELELSALARGELLSSAEHLPACARCNQKVRELRAVTGLLGALPEVEPSELEWKRIDRHVLTAMDSALIDRAVSRTRWMAAIPVAAALAACAVVGAKLVTLPHAASPEEALGVARPALAIAVGGDHGSTGHAGNRVVEGDTLSTTAGTLQIQTAPATGIALGPHARAEAKRLRTQATEIALEAGELLAEVKPLQPGQHFVVRAGDLSVQVVGTAFLVERQPGRVRVAVVHGRVRVVRDGRPDELFVSGGTEVTIPEGVALGLLVPGPLAPELAARFPLQFPELAPEEVEQQFGQAEIESEPAGADTRLDGASRGVTPLALLAEEGPHEVELSLPGHRPHKHAIKVSRSRAQAVVALAATPPESEVAPAPAPVPSPAPVAEPVHVRPARAKAPAAPQISYAEAFHRAAMSHRGEVEACYRSAGAEAGRPLHLVLSITPAGQVTPPVQAEEPGIDPRFVDCVNRVASTWSFPPPGRTYEISIPYDTRQGH